MGQRTCDTCMVKKRGDCIGGGPCDDYKAVPSFSDAEKIAGRW